MIKLLKAYKEEFELQSLEIIEQSFAFDIKENEPSIARDCSLTLEFITKDGERKKAELTTFHKFLTVEQIKQINKELNNEY